ncbi:zinc metalloprotease [Nocardia salmonicida]|uniref:hypothetical protein n=1 Tax=Nocardia salmonicida TaxID=53431 RepID=UPI0036288CE1
MTLSAKGVARQFLGRTGTISARQTFGPVPSGGLSLRHQLRSLARQEISFEWSEPNCIFGGTAAFEQIWSEIRVRVRLIPSRAVRSDPAGIFPGVRAIWETTIETFWSDKWAIGRRGEVACPLTFDVQFVDDDAHHEVYVDVCGVGRSCRTNSGNWYISDAGPVAAHEFGHLLGHRDEYSEPPKCPDRDPVGTGTVMDNNSNNVPARLMTRFATNVGSKIVPT